MNKTNLSSKQNKTFSGDVLAIYYKADRLARSNLLIHAYIEGEKKTLCKRIEVDHLADGRLNDKPTCESCLRKDERFND